MTRQDEIWNERDNLRKGLNSEVDVFHNYYHDLLKRAELAHEKLLEDLRKEQNFYCNRIVRKYQEKFNKLWLEEQEINKGKT